MVVKLLRRLAGRSASAGADGVLAGPSPGLARRGWAVRPESPLPSAWVKLSVWRRDRGECALCGSLDGVWFDYLVPVREGGAITEQNIRLACADCRRNEGDGSTRKKRRARSPLQGSSRSDDERVGG
jgi:5-methylcytosine-specific restriction endonuclease McrA